MMLKQLHMVECLAYHTSIPGLPLPHVLMQNTASWVHVTAVHPNVGSLNLLRIFFTCILIDTVCVYPTKLFLLHFSLGLRGLEFGM